MKLGKYDQKISFITQGTTTDNFGGVTPSEVVVLSTFARIEQLKAPWSIEQAQMSLPAVFRVGVQARRGFSVEDKQMVKWRDNLYRINAIYPFYESSGNNQTVNKSSIRYNQEIVFDITAK